jgi:ATP-dependent helicase/nuclease subunit B
MGVNCFFDCVTIIRVHHPSTKQLNFAHLADQGAAPWSAIAAGIQEWACAQGIALRDAVVLLPWARWLPHARRAFADLACTVPEADRAWPPQIETKHTLAARLGPAAAVPPGQISFDSAMDGLHARALLRSQNWGAAWALRDPPGFEHAARLLVNTAHELAHASFALHPTERAAYWERSRALLTPVAGPGATERLLARVAIEWTCTAPPPATDRLFATTPSAWIAVQMSVPDAFITQLMAHAVQPCLVLSLNPPPDQPFSALPKHTALSLAVCSSFEDEAQCTAAQVLAHALRGETPVALIAQDRVLVRRVRALLERSGLALADASGWKLSTTRAAAQVMALLKAATPDASTDALLDWLKAGTEWRDSAGVSALEALCRRESITRAAALAVHADLPPAVAKLWRFASGALLNVSLTQHSSPHQPAALPSPSLAHWLTGLAAALVESGAAATLQLDSAGQQVLKALHLAPHALPAGAQALPMTQAEFQMWVDEVLEQVTFLPTKHGETLDSAPVVITPLTGAALQNFAAVVLPGADDQHLGKSSAGQSVLSDAQACALGIPTAADAQTAELLAFVHALAVPRVTLLRRRTDGVVHLSNSPLVERLALALAAQNLSFTEWQDPRITVQLTPTPQRMPAPSVAQLMPKRLSASACEALRACPYRFFALNLLRLREDEELEREIEKRDYGTWLHAVLFDFHNHRSANSGQSSEAEVQHLMRLGNAQQLTLGLSEAEFLPFTASFKSFAPRYVAWLLEQETNGARWLHGEHQLSTQPEGLSGIELHGVIDRVDEVATKTTQTIKLIDYKTGSVSGLKEKIKHPLEDTQLAFYAALMRSQTNLPLAASYLALDITKGLEEVAHPDVEDSAQALLDGLAHDLGRMREGAGLPALGEGQICDHCSARGICRRDHWLEDAPSSAAAVVT